MIIIAWTESLKNLFCIQRNYFINVLVSQETLHMKFGENPLPSLRVKTESLSRCIIFFFFFPVRSIYSQSSQHASATKSRLNTITAQVALKPVLLPIIPPNIPFLYKSLQTEISPFSVSSRICQHQKSVSHIKHKRPFSS